MEISQPSLLHMIQGGTGTKNILRAKRYTYCDFAVTRITSHQLKGEKQVAGFD
jgi:hypothetical protein